MFGRGIVALGVTIRSYFQAKKKKERDENYRNQLAEIRKDVSAFAYIPLCLHC